MGIIQRCHQEGKKLKKGRSHVTIAPDRRCDIFYLRRARARAVEQLGCERLLALALASSASLPRLVPVTLPYTREGDVGMQLVDAFACRCILADVRWENLVRKPMPRCHCASNSANSESRTAYNVVSVGKSSYAIHSSANRLVGLTALPSVVPSTRSCFAPLSDSSPCYLNSNPYPVHPSTRSL